VFHFQSDTARYVLLDSGDVFFKQIGDGEITISIGGTNSHFRTVPSEIWTMSLEVAKSCSYNWVDTFWSDSGDLLRRIGSKRFKCLQMSPFSFIILANLHLLPILCTTLLRRSSPHDLFSGYFVPSQILSITPIGRGTSLGGHWGTIMHSFPLLSFFFPLLLCSIFMFSLLLSPFVINQSLEIQWCFLWSQGSILRWKALKLLPLPFHYMMH
jgi:hypothetical protein